MNSPSILFSFTVFFSECEWLRECVYVCNKLTTAALDSRCQPTDINKIGGKLAKKKTHPCKQTAAEKQTAAKKINSTVKSIQLQQHIHLLIEFRPQLTEGPEHTHTHWTDYEMDTMKSIHEKSLKSHESITNRTVDVLTLVFNTHRSYERR